ncbi:hypothetical protein BaRGS_00016488 [Batillaria attramentaria]|uniref:Uncharacterized protein n=1 Tax=Batillaria attramentaria TaxID=370345 RepID=A0ABD0KY90_9CAEN
MTKVGNTLYHRRRGHCEALTFLTVSTDNDSLLSDSVGMMNTKKLGLPSFVKSCKFCDNGDEFHILRSLRESVAFFTVLNSVDHNVSVAYCVWQASQRDKNVRKKAPSPGNEKTTTFCGHVCG